VRREPMREDEAKKPHLLTKHQAFKQLACDQYMAKMLPSEGSCKVEVIVSGLDLKSYLERFPAVCQQKFGRTYNFQALEKKLEPLRMGKRWLVAKDVLNIFDPAQTPFAHYWSRPNEKELDRALKSPRFFVGPIPSDRRELVKRALDVLHSIGLVSLVLRFVHPDRFGIFSTPIMQLLQVQGGKTVELYLAYCDELRVWKAHFGLASVAETETALWTFHELASQEETAGNGGEARAEFNADLWVQRRRVSRVLRPFLDSYKSLELARILVYEKPKLAGMIAGEEYERRLRAAARYLCGGMKLNVKGAIEMLFTYLVENGYISLEDKALLTRAWKTRNAAVHAGYPPDPEEVENMIDAIERICQWESPG
jgi:hypothetical protein